jgi:hypothetical protein
VLASVGQGLLHDPVGHQVHPRREPSGLPVDGDLHRRSSRAGLSHQLVEPSDAGLRVQCEFVAGLPQHTEQPAHLLQRVVADRPDRAQSLTSPGRVPLGDLLSRAGLDDDDRHAVRDHVMQLARDPAAFLGDGDPGFLLLVPRQHSGALLQLGRVQPPAAGNPPQQPGPAEVDDPVHELERRGRREIPHSWTVTAAATRSKPRSAGRRAACAATE